MEQPDEGWHSVLRDYLNGAATAINPIPFSNVQTFVPEDRAALFSDWYTVQKDMDHVWGAILLAQKLAESSSDERPEQQGE
jgi:hypothetical protein